MKKGFDKDVKYKFLKNEPPVTMKPLTIDKESIECWYAFRTDHVIDWKEMYQKKEDLDEYLGKPEISDQEKREAELEMNEYLTDCTTQVVELQEEKAQLLDNLELIRLLKEAGATCEKSE